MRLFPLLLLALFAFGQQSQPPSPTPRPSSHANHKKAKPEQQEASANDQTAKDLVTAINRLSTEIATWNQQQLAQQREQKPSPDWWSRVSTILITLFTFALAVLAYRQWRAMYRGANISDKQAQIAETQANIAAEQLAITKANESRRESEKTQEEDARYMQIQIADKRYLEQLTLAKDNAGTAKQSADAAFQLAHAMKRSVKLEEDSQRPWVDLRDWNVFRIQPTDPIEIEFKVANPTRLPFELHGILVTVDGRRIEEDAPVMLITPNDPLLHGIGVTLTPEQEVLYARNALHFEIDCTVLFADWHHIHWRQEIGCRLLCGHTIKPIFAVRKNTLAESGVPGESGSRDVELPK